MANLPGYLFRVGQTRGGGLSSPESAINRVVDGQAYDYFVAADGLAWYHDTGPDAIAAMNIPDPRSLLAELAPAAGFVQAGSAVVDGVRVTHLRGTALTALPVIPIASLGPGGHLTSLDVWVDGNGVVRRLSMTVVQQTGIITFVMPSGAPRGPVQFRVSRPTQKLLKTFEGLAHRQTTTQETTVLVTFLDIGQPQVITAPTNAIPVYGHG